MAYDKSKREEIQAFILEEIANGKSLSSVIRNNEGMPAYITVFEWINPKSDYYDEDFSYNYTIAVNERAEMMFEQTIDIADDQEGDVYLKDGERFVNHNVINRARLRVDTRKWALARMIPKKYADREFVDHTSLGKQIKPIDLSGLSTEALREIANLNKD